MRNNYTVTVKLKNEVLDPEGRAICEALQRLGHRQLMTVEVAKSYRLDFTEPVSLKVVEKIAEQLLSNAVAEQYTVE